MLITHTLMDLESDPTKIHWSSLYHFTFHTTFRPQLPPRTSDLNYGPCLLLVNKKGCFHECIASFPLTPLLPYPSFPHIPSPPPNILRNTSASTIFQVLFRQRTLGPPCLPSAPFLYSFVSPLFLLVMLCAWQVTFYGAASSPATDLFAFFFLGLASSLVCFGPRSGAGPPQSFPTPNLVFRVRSVKCPPPPWTLVPPRTLSVPVPAVSQPRNKPRGFFFADPFLCFRRAHLRSATVTHGPSWTPRF